MRFVPLFAALALAACATTTQPTAPVATTTPQAAATPAVRSPVALMLEAAGRNDAPTQQAVERLLGAPDLTRQEGAGAALTYRYEQCALLLLFTADAGNTMRLASAHPGPRRSGAAAPSIDQCAAEAAARR